MLTSILQSLLYRKKEVNLQNLPSRGMFYKDDFKIHIKRANEKDILEYKSEYTEKNTIIVDKLVNIVEKNAFLSKGYTHRDIKSIDIIFLFLEIVEYTNGEPIILDLVDRSSGESESISFGPGSFNYAEIDEKMHKTFNKESRDFTVFGYRYSIPSIGAASDLSRFIQIKAHLDKSYLEYSYDLIYFTGHKSGLEFKELDNLVQIFNFDLDPSERKKVRSIVEMFSNLNRYSVNGKNSIIDLSGQINLEKIWK